MMTTSTRTKTIQPARKGVALVMVLTIVLAITIVSTGFLVRADVELRCGENMALRLQMDQLADSALEHAKGLILRPHDVPSTYWAGDTTLQLVSDSQDYYDVNVTRDETDYCTYSIECEAYRLRGIDEKVGRSRLSAQLRLDPCIAIWTGTDLVFRQGWTGKGDLYCAEAVTNFGGSINGDVYASALSGSVDGQHHTTDQLALAWPAAAPSDFVLMHGTATVTPGTMASETLGPYDPARVSYCNGDLILAGDVTVNGMLLVDGDLVIRGARNTILAAKNMPAVYVTGNLTIENASELDIQGLAMVGQKVFIRSDCTDIEITGALFVVGQIAETARDDSGQGNDAVVCGQTTWRPLAGSAGGAMEFSGIDGYLRTADSATQLQMANDYTLCTWIKPASTQNDFAGIISRCNAAGTENHWTLQFDRYGDALRICHYSSIWNIGLTCDQVADGSWHHLAIVREGNQMRTYLDSVLVSTGTFDTAPGSGDGHLNIGADMTGSPSYVYTGLLDDVRIYDAALSQANITDIHAQLPVAITPIGHWKLDGADSVVTVTAEPALASVILPVEVPGMSHITDEHWSPAAGAFFRNIQRE